MAKESAILYIDEDIDDYEIIKQVIDELQIPNKMEWVRTGEEAFQYLEKHEAPFIIFCDYKLPRMDGIELRKRIEADEQMRTKAIPFIFFSTVVSRKMVEEVYKMNVQGLFEKGTKYEEIKELLKHIFEYWQRCKHPNN